MSVFYIQRADKPSVFDETDPFTFENRKFAVLDDGTPRYTDNWIGMTSAGDFDLHLTNVSPSIVAIVVRLLGVQPITGSNPKGWVEDPDMVKFHKGNSTFYYRPSTGEQLVARAKPKAA